MENKLNVQKLGYEVGELCGFIGIIDTYCVEDIY